MEAPGNDKKAWKYFFALSFSRFDEEKDVNCGCAEPCDSIIYSSYVLNRKYHNISVPTSQIYAFYTTKVYSVRRSGNSSKTNALNNFLQKIEEMPGYDLSQFVADMGGSLGFLLGLSVLGLIGLFKKVKWQITTTIEAHSEVGISLVQFRISDDGTGREASQPLWKETRFARVGGLIFA